MRIRHVLLASLLMLTLGTLGASPSVLADPGSPYATTYCDPPFTDTDGDVWQDCYTARGVTQLTLLPSGDFKYTSNGTVTNTTTVNGVVRYSDSSAYRFTDLFRGGDYMVARSYTQAVIVTTDPAGEVTTCILKSNLVEIDGALRADVSSFECAS